MIDTNVNLSRWPFRRVRGDTPAELAAMLRKHGVTAAWAGSFDGILHKDIAAVNARLAADCRAHPLFLPFGSINPKLPDWKEDLRRCHEVHRMKGIRLHPNYHGYTLKDPIFKELAAAADQRGLIVEIALVMEDSRTQHPLVRVPRVDAAPLLDVLPSLPKLRVLLLNDHDSLNQEQLRRLAAAGQVYFEFAMAEGLGGLERLLTRVPLERVVFSSHAPLFYFESALLKVREAGMNGLQKRAVLEGNAKRLLGS